MADVKITALAVLTAADPINDAIPIVDVSDFSMAASGTTKRISVNNILSSSPTASGALTVTGLVTAGSATITGDLTVRTTGLILNTSGLGVGITPTSFGAGYGTIQVSGATGAGIRMGSPTNGSFIYSDASFFNFVTETNVPYRFQANNQIQHTIAPLGVFTWYNGAGGTRMTLDSTGLNVVGKVAIGGASLTYPLNVRASSSNVGNTAFLFEQLNGTPIVTMRDNGTVVVAGDIRVGNTVNTVSPTSPNRTITMIVNGVTLYIAAKTTND